jgi:hypothetical protein
MWEIDFNLTELPNTSFSVQQCKGGTKFVQEKGGEN